MQRNFKKYNFLDGFKNGGASGKFIYGECGGSWCLARTLTDASGTSFAMSGLLDLKTTFENPKLSLGYRLGELTTDCPLGKRVKRFVRTNSTTLA
ncbi:MAG: hypothetical protein CM15mP62_01400 [Rhodospirillaceae bacterium]|nr:MAG: hypothetical protein CM15mP62_01400 [Rhodospirillaceae bacterium]